MSEPKKRLSTGWRLTLRAWRIGLSCCPGAFVATVLHALLAAGTPYIALVCTARLIAELSGARNPAQLRLDTLLLLTLSAAAALAQAVCRHWRRAEESVLMRAYNHVYMEKWLRMDFPDVDSQAAYDLYSRIRQVANMTGFGLSEALEQFAQFLTPLFRIAGGAALCFRLFTAQVPDGPMQILNAPAVSAAILALALLVCLLGPLFSALADRYITRYTAEGTRGNRFFGFYGLMCTERERAADLRIYRQQERVCNVYFERGNTFGPSSRIARWARGGMGLLRTLSESLSALITCVIYLFVCLKAWGGAFGPGEVAQYTGAATGLFLGLAELLKALSACRTNSSFLQDTFRFLELPNRMYQGSLTTEKRSDREYEIEFRDVSFRYPGAERDALQHVSLHFRVGCRLAVVGQNGSGKTTFIKLLCRLYDPTEGEILLNGIDIRKYRYDEYMALFSVVFQDFQLLALPLGQNVASNRQYDAARAEACLRQAGFGARLDSLPKGLQTSLYRELDPEGVELSGGEAQKIALARALYRDTPLIILDEPTAALDPLAEAEVYEKFSEISGDKTAIYISHRLSSCKFCDEIAVFEDGRIAQVGTHAELVHRPGPYRALWQAQAQYYKAAPEQSHTP